MFALACGLALFLLLYAGRVHVVACQLRGDAQCVVQELVLGVHEMAREQIVGARRVEIVTRTYEYRDDDGRTRTGSEQLLTFFDVSGFELRSMPLSTDRFERNARIWIAELERALAQGHDRLPRLWFANIPALVAGSLMWVGICTGLLGMLVAQSGVASRVVLGLGLAQALALGGLILALLMFDEPPPTWPGLALPERLPNIEH